MSKSLGQPACKGRARGTPQEELTEDFEVCLLRCPLEAAATEGSRWSL